MATGLILNKFLCYQTEAAFNADLKAGYVSDKSIVFVLDKQYIYSHGKIFYCEFSPEVQKVLSAAITGLEDRIDIIETVLAAAITDLENNKIGLDDLNVESIKADIAAEGARLGLVVDAHIKRIEDAIDSTDVEHIGDIELVAASGIAENHKAILDNESAISAALNDIRSQIRDLQKQINNLK